MSKIRNYIYVYIYIHTCLYVYYYIQTCGYIYLQEHTYTIMHTHTYNLTRKYPWIAASPSQCFLIPITRDNSTPTPRAPVWTQHQLHALSVSHRRTRKSANSTRKYWIVPEDEIYRVDLQTLHFHSAFIAFVLYFVLRGRSRPQAHGGHMQSSQR